MLINLFRFSYSLVAIIADMFRKRPTIPSNVTHLIVGIGNPDPAYNNTRHNVGKMFIKTLAKDLKQDLSQTSCGLISFHSHKNTNTAIFCTNTFMNLSGKPIRSLFDSLKLKDIKCMVVVHDDLDTKIGLAKLKEGGSAEGHNGIKSIIDNFKGEKEFLRLKIGIDRPQSKDVNVVSDYVLGKFEHSERQLIESQAYVKCLQILTSRGFL